MKKFDVFAAALALPLVLVQGCENGGDATSDTADTADSGDTDPTAGGEEVCGSEVAGTIEQDTTWTCEHTLSGIVNVKDGATLTIEPGVTIQGLNGSALVVSKGARLVAEGTAEAPIVFTSALPEGSRARGDWGGIVLIGEAPNNLQTGAGAAEGLDPTNPDFQYGGSDAASSCGSLQYVRVEFAGFELVKDSELNGITFYSCGSGTKVDYVQVHMGKDDGIEMFGGTWSGKHIVVTGALDDSIDVDQGYQGTLQHVFVQQEASGANYAFELSNQKDNLDASPRTRPVFANVTAIGNACGGANDTTSAGVRLKEGAAAEFHGAIFTCFNNAAVELTEAATEALFPGETAFKNDLFFSNAAVDGGASAWVVGEGSSFDLAGAISDAAAGNHVDVDPMLTSTAWGSPDIAPKAGSPVLGAGEAPAGADAADYIGAVKDAASDWTKGGWANWRPE